jgi:predicted nucleotidyltransferase
VFTVEERDRVRERLLALAEADPAVAGAAITGSYVVAGGDEWSDIDLAFSIGGELPRALERWTKLLYEDFAAIHHWDLPWGSTVYRVFLEGTLVRSLDELELRRALAAAADALSAELERTDPTLAARLSPMLRNVTGVFEAA